MSSFLGKKALNAYRNILGKQLVELEAAHAATEENRAPVALDQTTQGRLSRMDALQVQAMALETDRRREIQIKRVEAAIERTDDGDRGSSGTSTTICETNGINNFNDYINDVVPYIDDSGIKRQYCMGKVYCDLRLRIHFSF